MEIGEFKNDKIFEENYNYFILTEGIILNPINLIYKYNVKSQQ